MFVHQILLCSYWYKTATGYLRILAEMLCGISSCFFAGLNLYVVGRYKTFLAVTVKPQRLLTAIDSSNASVLLPPFSALTLLVWQQEGYLVCKKLGIGLLMLTFRLELCISYSSSSSPPPPSSSTPLKSRMEDILVLANPHSLRIKAV